MTNIELKEIMDKAILGTSLNYPNLDVASQISSSLIDYYDSYFNGLDPISRFSVNYSKKNHKYGFLRNKIIEYGNKNNYDVVLGFLDILKDFCEVHLNDDTLSTGDRLSINKFYSNYIKITEDINGSLINKSNDIHKKINCLKPLLVDNYDDIYRVCGLYFLDIKEKELTKSSGIDVIEITNTGKNILTNCTDFGIMNTFGGSLLSGKITLESNRGYIAKPDKIQQDAVLSVVKSDNCFLNIVADGVGGIDLGEKASSAIVGSFKKWFDSMEEEQFLSLSEMDLCYSIDSVLKNTNNYLYDEYRGSAASTVVLGLTVGEKTLIFNIGDSTAYKYDYNNDELISLTTLDSYSNGLSYEDARYNPDNNCITKGVGFEPLNTGILIGHYKFIDNDGSRVILSSDGVTDLISEERFKSYFKNNTTAGQIVNDAVYNPDIAINKNTGKPIKSSDNVSAIVVDLPNNVGKKYGRRG